MVETNLCSAAEGLRLTQAPCQVAYLYYTRFRSGDAGGYTETYVVPVPESEKLEGRREYWRH